MTSWHCVNVNSGGSAIDTPYRAGKKSCQFMGADAPLRHGLLPRPGRHGQ